jgi:succinate dehydrogenase/fumarate reductase flavoprotein subunit
VDVSADALEAALQRIDQLESENHELSIAVYQYRMVLEHYLSICASIGAEVKPAVEALAKYDRLRVRPHLRRIK